MISSCSLSAYLIVRELMSPLSCRVLRHQCEMLPKFPQILKNKINLDIWIYHKKNVFLNGIGPLLKWKSEIFMHRITFRVSQSYYLDGSKLDEWKLHEPCVWGRHEIVLAICFRKKSTGWKWEFFLSVHKLFEWEIAKTQWHTRASIVWWD